MIGPITIRCRLISAVVGLISAMTMLLALAATQIDVVGPPGSELFGK